jgi:hypothetical protein
MRTIKTIPTVILAVSLGTSLMSATAFARDGGHQEHNDHQDRGFHQDHNDHQDRGSRLDHNDRRSGSDERSTRQATRSGATGKSDKGKVAVTGIGSGAGSAPTINPPTHGGNPPRAPAPPTSLPPPTHGGTPPRGPVADAPGGPAVVSNGQVKLYIANSPSGLSVTSDKAGTITVSNGDPNHSVTLPGGSVTISGGNVTTVGGAPGVQVISHPNGDFVAATTGPAKTVPVIPGHVTGGPEGGFLNALGSGLKDLTDPFSFSRSVPAENVTPPPATSTIYQR